LFVGLLNILNGDRVKPTSGAFLVTFIDTLGDMAFVFLVANVFVIFLTLSILRIDLILNYDWIGLLFCISLLFLRRCEFICLYDLAMVDKSAYKLVL